MLEFSPLLMFSVLCWQKNNIQHSMLANPEKKEDIYSQVYQEMFPTDMLSL